MGGGAQVAKELDQIPVKITGFVQDAGERPDRDGRKGGKRKGPTMDGRDCGNLVMKTSILSGKETASPVKEELEAQIASVNVGVA